MVTTLGLRLERCLYGFALALPVSLEKLLLLVLERLRLRLLFAPDGDIELAR